MQAINMKASHRLLILTSLHFIMIAFGQKGQAEIPEKFKNRQYTITFNHLSEDGNYMFFLKDYEYRSDTLVVLEGDNPDNVIYQKHEPIMRGTKFTKKGNLFILGENSAELLHLHSRKVRKWSGIIDGKYDEINNQILILENERMVILDENGNVQSEISNVEKIINVDQHTYVVIKNKTSFSIGELLINKINPLFDTSIIPTIVYSDVDYLFFVFQNDILKRKELIAFNKNTFKKLTLRNVLSEDFNSMKIFSTGIKGEYFLSAIVNTKYINKDEVDVWHADDNALEKKYFGDNQYVNGIWKPAENDFQQFGNSSFSETVFIGNSRYYVFYDSCFYQDYINPEYSHKIYRYDKKIGSMVILGDLGHTIHADPKGNYLLSIHKGSWEIYDLQSRQKKAIPLKIPDLYKYQTLTPYFSEDSNKILFNGNGHFSVYDISKENLVNYPILKNYFVTIINPKQKQLGNDIYSYTYSTNIPVLLKLHNLEENKTGYAIFNGNNVNVLVKPTEEKVTSLVPNGDYSIFSYLKSTITNPPQLYTVKDKNHKKIYSSNSFDKNIKNIRVDKIFYKNSEGKKLVGILIYPLFYEKNKKYPMIVNIYGRMRHLNTEYLRDGLNSVAIGLNPRRYIENGYFIFFPDIVTGRKGTGKAALDCLNHALDEVAKIKEINMNKVGLIGHSLGGYETNFIATQSDRFAAYVSGSGNSDLVKSYFSFNLHYKTPYYWQFENGQYEMSGPFAHHKKLYIKNSPIMYAEKVKSPILLWTGMEDFNVHWEQSREFLMALKRNKKKAIALFYPTEGHSLLNVNNKVDLAQKIEDWFEHFLKDNRKEWISVKE